MIKAVKSMDFAGALKDRFFKNNKEEESIMYIIAGLGNPGRKYMHTRHNSGYEAVDILADKYGIRVENEKFHALTGTGVIEGQKVMILKPLTYMNASGESIRAACEFYKLDPEEDLIVLYDDISLPVGALRVRAKGSAGGHNGIKSVIAQLGTQIFKRIKIGVGEKPEGWDLVDYVLGQFPEDEQGIMKESFARAGEAAAMLLNEDVEKVMNQYNAKTSHSL